MYVLGTKPLIYILGPFSLRIINGNAVNALAYPSGIWLKVEALHLLGKCFQPLTHHLGLLAGVTNGRSVLITSAHWGLNHNIVLAGQVS